METYDCVTHCVTSSSVVISSRNQYRGQTFAHARVVLRAELSARTKTEDKYTSGGLHNALEKRVNKIMRG